MPRKSVLKTEITNYGLKIKPMSQVPAAFIAYYRVYR